MHNDVRTKKMSKITISLATAAFQYAENKHPDIVKNNLKFDQVYRQATPAYTPLEWSLGFEFFEYSSVIMHVNRQQKIPFWVWLEMHEAFFANKPKRAQANQYYAKEPTEGRPIPPNDFVISSMEIFHRRPLTDAQKAKILPIRDTDALRICLTKVYTEIYDAVKDQYTDAEYTALINKSSVHANDLSSVFNVECKHYTFMLEEWTKYDNYKLFEKAADADFLRRKSVYQTKINHLYEGVQRWFQTNALPRYAHFEAWFVIDDFFYTLVEEKDNIDYQPFGHFQIQTIYSFDIQYTISEWKTILGSDMINVDAENQQERFRLCDVLKFCTPHDLTPSTYVIPRDKKLRVLPPALPINAPSRETYVPNPPIDRSLAKLPQAVLTDIRRALQAQYTKQYLPTYKEWEFNQARDEVDKQTAVVPSPHPIEILIDDAEAILNRKGDSKVRPTREFKEYLLDKWIENQEQIANVIRLENIARNNPHVRYATHVIAWIRRFRHWQRQVG